MKSSFQEVIFTLQKFWAKQGLAVLQPYDANVGAGTLCPATVLRCFDEKPWKVCYVQGCRRPTDARYAANPNRLSYYFQFQVIVKPSPSNAKELYLKSLEEIGINVNENDIRFVHDDWKNPSIGAKGIGWEVWMNAMEVSQFTYMQQVGGLELKEIPTEITYGLERIVCALQKVESIFDMKWNESMTYGDIFKRNEIEMSGYYKEFADVKLLFKRFSEYKEECRFLLENGLPIPAYEQAISASHALNVLDSRGCLSQNERASYILQIRQLVKDILSRYVSAT